MFSNNLQMKQQNLLDRQFGTDDDVDNEDFSDDESDDKDYFDEGGQDAEDGYLDGSVFPPGKR